MYGASEPAGAIGETFARRVFQPPDWPPALSAVEDCNISDMGGMVPLL
jgi:hypothetical protein